MEPKIKSTLGIVAGIVTFNPDLPRLRENIESVLGQVDEIILIDNASAELASLSKLVEQFPRVYLYSNGVNAGMAKALNQAMKWAEERGASWSLLLDQDSVCEIDMVDVLAQNVTAGVGIVAPAIIDRSDRDRPAQQGEQEEVNYCITSGSLNSVNMWQSVGGYDESLFIDFVDFDYCLRARESGFRIIRESRATLLHEIGRITRHGRFIAYNHSAFRSYHMARDMIYYARKHRRSPRELRVQKRGLFATYLILLRKSIIVAIFEEDRLSRVSALVRGTIAGSIGRRHNT